MCDSGTVGSRNGGVGDGKMSCVDATLMTSQAFRVAFLGCRLTISLVGVNIKW